MPRTCFACGLDLTCCWCAGTGRLTSRRKKTVKAGQLRMSRVSRPSVCWRCCGLGVDGSHSCVYVACPTMLAGGTPYVLIAGSPLSDRFYEDLTPVEILSAIDNKIKQLVKRAQREIGARTGTQPGLSQLVIRAALPFFAHEVARLSVARLPWLRYACRELLS